MNDESPVRVPFQAHIELLRVFLGHREEIVERIQDVLNAQRKPAAYLQDRRLLSAEIEDCFFAIASINGEYARLRLQLQDAHRASGFMPRRVSGMHNDLIDPAEMMVRGFYCWQQTRWPGRNGRMRYAHTLFDVYMLRNLELLSMRVCDAGAGSAGERLAAVQSVLDALWRGAPADQPAFVRDARWLIPLAQSPTTDELAAYFEVAENVATMLPASDQLEIQKAHARMLGGHLTSQIRHYCIKDAVAFDDKSVVLRTRTSNALDFALLIQCLVALLKAYERVLDVDDPHARRDLAGAICQAISPDPEVFVNRVELLGAYSMIEHLFVATNPDGTADYTPMGARHIRLTREYAALIGRLSRPLHEDCAAFRPVEGAFSPYGAIFGTPSHLTEHMALKTIDRGSTAEYGLEDIFTDGDTSPKKLEWVNGWRALPHIDPEVQKLHRFPAQFARDIFGRIESELARRAAAEADDAGVRTGRLYIIEPPGGRDREARAATIPALPARFIVSSDPDIVAAGEAEPYDHAQLLRDRQEGHFIVSYETSGGWAALRKDMLTEVLGAGEDAKVDKLPPAAAAVMRLTCPGLLADQASVPPSILNA